MDRNVRIYPWYYAISSFLVWMPVFFWYFSEYLTLQQVLLLEAIYYISVVVLEVPSGYFSDVFGRKTTLTISATALCLAIVSYIIGGSFLYLVIGQVLFAAFMAFRSGTDTVLYFESLQAVGREMEYGDLEAQVNRKSQNAAGLGALLGGLVGMISLKATFYPSLIAAAIALVLVIQFKEPGRDQASKPKPFLRQLLYTRKYFSKKIVAWIFAFYVFMYVMAHVPYEFYQPYLKLLEDGQGLWSINAVLLSGILMAIQGFSSAFTSGRSMQWQRRLGMVPFFLLCALALLFIIGSMGLVLHPVMLLVVLGRNMPWAAVKAPVYSVITPAIEKGQRATFYSLMSLGGRFGFFLILFFLSTMTGNENVDSYDSISKILLYCLGIGISLGVVIFAFSKNIGIAKMEDA